MSSADGLIQYTAKEMLERIDRKLDHLDEKLDTKAERTRVDELVIQVQAIDRRVGTIESTMVKREGPIIDELRDFEGRVQRLENGMSTAIRDEIKQAHAAAERASDRAWTVREKIMLGFFALIGALGTLISMVVLILQLGHHGG